MRIALIILGCVSLGLGVAGIFLPLLPTTPFLLLTAGLWMRSSPRLYDWLLSHPRMGEYIRNYNETRAIPLRVKIFSVTLMWAAMLYTIFGVVDEWWWAQVLLFVVGAGVTWHILSFDTLRK